MNNTNFIKALNENNIELLKQIEKTDLHNHSFSSCTKEYISKSGLNIPSNESIVDIASLIAFARKYFGPIRYKKEENEILFRGNFENCIETGVSVVSTSIDYKICINTFNSDAKAFVEWLKQFKYDNLKILLDIDISRDSYKDEHEPVLIDMIGYCRRLN